MMTHRPEWMSVQEQWSALHDGELSAEQAAALVSASLADDGLMLQWRSMSAISHVLREQPSKSAASPIASMPRQEAANDGVFRWKRVAGLAAFAAVGSLAWGLLAGSGAGNQAGILAQSQNAPPLNASGQTLTVVGGQIAGQEVTMIRDPRLDELLAAHRQFGGSSALQQPAGSLRSVSLGGVRP